MFPWKIEKGQMEDCPFIRFGDGKEKIVIFPLINDALFTVSEVSWYFRALFAPLCRDYSIYVIGRKRKLSLGYSTEEMARDYARVFERGDFGQVHLIGISLGGMIAQHFAHTYPHFVKRLIIVSSAHHMGPEGLAIARRWIPWTKSGMWNEIYEETVRISFHKGYRFVLKWVQPFAVRFLKKKMTAQRADDFIISGQAGVLHDSSKLLGALELPTLIMGGTDDPFFPESIFKEMNEKINNSESLSIQGARHLVLDEHKSECMKTIRAFLKNPEKSFS